MFLGSLSFYCGMLDTMIYSIPSIQALEGLSLMQIHLKTLEYLPHDI